jgi:Fe-S oxidoreductase
MRDGTAAYHDSCYLGRYNSIYDEPRFILKSTFDGEIKEVLRHRERGMCCGAGGGKMWYEEARGKRINYTRFEEFEEISANVVATACPYCMIMLDDATKYKGLEEKVKVKDVSQLVAEQLIK